MKLSIIKYCIVSAILLGTGNAMENKINHSNTNDYTKTMNELSDKITTQKWLTPEGNWIHKKGITPDIELEDNLETEEDEQLDEAIRILSEKES